MTLDQTRVAEIRRLESINAELLAAIKPALAFVAYAYAKGVMSAEECGRDIEAAIAKAEGKLDAVGRIGGPSVAGSLPPVSPTTES